MSNHDPMLCILFGGTGTGKTYQQKEESDRVLRERARAGVPTNLIVYDPEGGKQGYELKDQIECFSRADMRRAILSRRRGQGPPIVLRVPVEDWDLRDLPDGHPKRAEVPSFYHDTVLVLDEAADLMTPSKIDPSLSTLMRRGRKWGMDIIVGSQRPRGIHNDVIGNAQRGILLPQGTDSDRKKLEGLEGFKIPKGYVWKPAIKDGKPHRTAVLPVIWTRSPLSIVLP